MADQARTDAAVNRYITRIPRVLLDQDPETSVQLHMLRDILARVDQAMDQEGLPEEIRDRVVHAVLHDGVDEETAFARMEARALKEMARMPVVIPVDLLAATSAVQSEPGSST